MATPAWNTLKLVLLTGGSEQATGMDLPADADAVVIKSGAPRPILAALGTRTALPVIIVADVDDAAAAALVEAGAADVLPCNASFEQISRAARHAVARARRDEGDAAATSRASSFPRPVPASRMDELPADPLEPMPPPATSLASPQAVTASAAAVPDSPRGQSLRREGSVRGDGQGEVIASGRRDGPEMPPQLRAVGRLAGGIAHDFNNLLQVISGNAEALLHGGQGVEQRKGSAQAIIDSARRAALLTHQLLAFGRRQTLIATPVDVSALVSEAMPQLRARLGAQIRVLTQLGTGLPQVHADKSQLLQVLSNLADNACEAMTAGGTLTIAADVVEVDDEMRRVRPWLTAGRFVRLQVNDTGSGIDEHALPHLFEPFFSQWNGTGLGLSSVYGIIKQSGGFIWVDSRLGEGTRITILLPTAVAAVPVVDAPPPDSRGRVLLVEDDDAVRDLLQGVLTHYGFSVAAYPTAEDALEHQRPFDLLLTDVLLPGRNGPELTREMKRRRPGLPVLLISGDTGHVVDPGEVDARGFLQKPFSAHTLVARVEELLEGAPAGEPRRGDA